MISRTKTKLKNYWNFVENYGERILLKKILNELMR